MAGSFTKIDNRRTVVYRGLDKPYGLAWELTSDASDASVDDELVLGITGFIAAIDVEFDATAAPTSVAITIKTAAGISIIATGTLSASGRYVPDAPVPIADGMIISATVVGNSKKAKVICYVF